MILLASTPGGDAGLWRERVPAAKSVSWQEVQSCGGKTFFPLPSLLLSLSFGFFVSVSAFLCLMFMPLSSFSSFVSFLLLDPSISHCSFSSSSTSSPSFFLFSILSIFLLFSSHFRHLQHPRLVATGYSDERDRPTLPLLPGPPRSRPSLSHEYHLEKSPILPRSSRHS